VSLRPIGGIYLRLNSSGNLTIYDASGNVVATILSGALSTTFNTAEATFSTDYTTNSSSVVSVGPTSGVDFTPQVSSRAVILAYFYFQVATAGDGAQLLVYRTTSTVPAQGSPASGTLVAQVLQTCQAATTNYGVSCIGVNTGLTAGTRYTYYMGLASPNSVNVSLLGATAGPAHIWVFEQ
jgi:hypothetical protein